MDERRVYLLNYIKQKLQEFSELGKQYSDEKIESLADNLLKSDKSLEEITNLVDNKFSYQLRKINHNNHLISLKEYYINSIDKLSKNNNCYLLSYNKGVKVLEQANLEYVDTDLGIVTINKDRKAFVKSNSVKNDYDLVLSDIAYVIDIPYAKTYRIFDSSMKENGVLNECFDKTSEKFLNFEEVLKFVKEESSKFTLKEELVAYHDKNIKKGFKEVTSKKDYIDNLEYVIKLFKALPDIDKNNIEELIKSYLNMKIFELLTNSVDNNLNNIGLIINKEKLKYTYRLSPSYNKCVTKLDGLDNDSVICNFYIVKKIELLKVIIDNYYDYVKELLYIIKSNKDTLVPIIDQLLKEHLDYEEYSKYYDLFISNYEMISNEADTIYIKEEDKELLDEVNDLYTDRIAPFIDDYVSDDFDNRGSVLLVGISVVVLAITLVLVGLAIFFVSSN